MSAKIVNDSGESLAQSQAQVSAADSGQRAPYVAPTVVPLSMSQTDSGGKFTAPGEFGSTTGS